MRIVYISNFMNHHQLPLAKAFYNILGDDYKFIALEPIPTERKNMGYVDMNNSYSFILRAYESNDNLLKAKQLADNCDVLILGNGSDEFMKNRLKSGELTFKCSERYFKKCLSFKDKIYNFLSAEKHIVPFQKYSLYYLCSSAYTAADVNKYANFKNRTYKWGYFPEVKKYDSIEAVIESKEPASILWVGRLIELKHPDGSIRVAKKLKEQGHKFHLNIIGNGELEEKLKRMIDDESLTDCVTMLGSMSPDEVRKYMEKSQIFLFTSDFNEGWGAVLNESMNSGCAVVASHAIGSVPYLLQDNINGLIYKNGDIDDLFNKVKYLLDNPQKCKEFGEAAYQTLNDKWNADVAAKRFLQIANELQSGNKDISDLFEVGPCSKAEILENGWFE